MAARLDAAGLEVLVVALQAYDRLAQARSVVDREGLLITGARGGQRPHPALRIEAAARSGFLAAWRTLRLLDAEVEEEPDIFP